MRCKIINALVAGVAVFSQPVHAQQIPPEKQLKAPAATSSPSAAPASSATAAATGSKQAAAQVANSPSASAPVSPGVQTLSQAAAAPNQAPASAPPTPDRQLSVPPIVENSELATGSNSKKMDAAGPASAAARPKALVQQEIVLLRVSYVDDEVRALLKVHGATRYVHVGSTVQKKIVTSISDDGVCLNSMDKKEVARKDKQKSSQTCLQNVSFPFQQWATQE